MPLAAPTVFGADSLLADVAADFAVRGITGIELAVGEWVTEMHDGTPRVVIGLGKATIDDPANTPHSTDGWIDVGNGQVASPILQRRHTFPIWVHDIADDAGDPSTTALRARIATATLLDQTCAAIRRTRGGLPILPWPMEPLNEERGEFIYGACWLVTATIAVPIFGDPSDTMIADGVTTTAQALLPDGSLVPPVPETSNYP